MSRRIRRALGNESGAGLIDTMVGAIVSAVLIGVVAAGIAMMLLYPLQQAGIAKTTGEIAAADAQFRADVRTAKTAAVNEGTLELTMPGTGCDVAWSAEGEGTLKLVRTECPSGASPDERVISADAGTVELVHSGGLVSLTTGFGEQVEAVRFTERTAGIAGEPGPVEGVSTYDGITDLSG